MPALPPRPCPLPPCRPPPALAVRAYTSLRRLRWPRGPCPRCPCACAGFAACAVVRPFTRTGSRAPVRVRIVRVRWFARAGLRVRRDAPASAMVRRRGGEPAGAEPQARQCYKTCNPIIGTFGDNLKPRICRSL